MNCLLLENGTREGVLAFPGSLIWVLHFSYVLIGLS